jgi:hypothetical protein
MGWPTRLDWVSAPAHWDPSVLSIFPRNGGILHQIMQTKNQNIPKDAFQHVT